MYDEPLLLKIDLAVRDQGCEVRVVTDRRKEKFFHPALVSEQVDSSGNVSDFN